MSQTSSFVRQLLLIRKIRSLNQQDKFPSLEDLMAYVKKEFDNRHSYETGVSEPTLKRDFKHIRDYFRIQICYDKKEKGYFIDEEVGENSLVEQTLESFEILSAIGADGLMPKHIIPEKRKVSKGLEHFGHLNRYIEQKKTVTFGYIKYDSDTKTQPIVQPLFLKESRNRWYLLAQSENETVIKAYALDRIMDLESTEKPFKLSVYPEEIEIKYNDCFAMFTSDKPAEKVVLSFDLRDGNYIKSYPIHHSQTVDFNTEEVLVTLQIKITLDFIMELMSRAWSVKVIEPLSLKTQLHQIFNEASLRNA